MNRSSGKRLRLLLTLVLAAGVLALPSVARAHVGGFPEVGTDFGDPGPYEVTVLPDGDHTIYHPAVLGEGGVHHPVILWGNGTGTSPSAYDRLLRHFASHGFIVAAANTTNAGSGQEMLAGFEKLQAWNAEEGNAFQGKVNVDDAGATGHSQGGGGALNAGAHPRVSTVFPLQPWRGDASAVTGSALFLSGGNDTVVTPRSVETAFGNAGGIPAAYAELAGASHFVPLGDAGGFRYAATAWARMVLMADENARSVFFGDDCTLCTAAEWEYRVNAGFGGWAPPAADVPPGGHDGHDHEPGTPPDHDHDDDHDHGDHDHDGGQVGPGDGDEADDRGNQPPRGRASVLERLFQRLRGLVGGTPAPANPSPVTPAPGDDGHDHEPGTPPDHDHDHDHGDDGGHDDGGHDHGGDDCVPEPYTATLPVDLCGHPGVTPEQQAEAEALVTETIERLPQWADYRDAEAAGFRSIGDGVTGHEHFINWAWIDDEHQFNPDYPESLVYERRGGERVLVAAMYMLNSDQTLDDVPDIGGDLIQWHVHDDLCYDGDWRTGASPRLAGLTDSDGNCRPGTYKGAEVPMIHVWIVPHDCGPFSALEGIGGGSVREGEEHQCLEHHH